jgi:hypothetical protein
VFSSVNSRFDALKPMIGGMLNIKHVLLHWGKILRLATFIKQARWRFPDTAQAR